MACNCWRSKCSEMLYVKMICQCWKLKCFVKSRRLKCFLNPKSQIASNVFEAITFNRWWKTLCFVNIESQRILGMLKVKKCHQCWETQCFECVQERNFLEMCYVYTWRKASTYFRGCEFLRPDFFFFLRDDAPDNCETSEGKGDGDTCQLTRRRGLARDACECCARPLKAWRERPKGRKQPS